MLELNPRFGDFVAFVSVLPITWLAVDICRQMDDARGAVAKCY